MLIGTKSSLLNILGFAPAGDLGPLTGYTAKNRKPVWFIKSPPLSPATGWQRQQRNKFRAIAILWSRLQPQQRIDWQRSAERANLTITGYNLFVWYQHSDDHLAIETVERQSGITLLPLF